MKGCIVLLAACVLLASSGCGAAGHPTRPPAEGGSPLADFFSVAGQTILYVVGAVTYGIVWIVGEAVRKTGERLDGHRTYDDDDDDDDNVYCPACGTAPCQGGHSSSQGGNTPSGSGGKKKESQVAPLLKKKP